MTRLKKFYQQKVIPELKKILCKSNDMEVPYLEKIVLNMGVGEVSKNKKLMWSVLRDLGFISGQKAIVTRSKKSISGFKIREGWPVGAKLTLRKNYMYEFLDRLITIVIPRIRDFRGFSNESFDGYGNYNLGIKEQISFPEIDYDNFDKIRGLNITINTTSFYDFEAKALLDAFHFPLKQ